MYVFCLRACICTTCIPDAHEDQKRVLNSLVPELQMVITCNEFKEQNQGPLEEEQVLSATEPSFQSLKVKS